MICLDKIENNPKKKKKKIILSNMFQLLLSEGEPSDKKNVHGRSDESTCKPTNLYHSLCLENFTTTRTLYWPTCRKTPSLSWGPLLSSIFIFSFPFSCTKSNHKSFEMRFTWVAGKKYNTLIRRNEKGVWLTNLNIFK